MKILLSYNKENGRIDIETVETSAMTVLENCDVYAQFVAALMGCGRSLIKTSAKAHGGNPNILKALELFFLLKVKEYSSGGLGITDETIIIKDLPPEKTPRI